MKTLIITFIIVAALITGAIHVMAVLTTANAHDWYPSNCCSGKDCAPAQVRYHADGSITATTKHGTVTFPAGTDVRPSPDGAWHACMRTQFSTGNLKGLCLFGAPGV